MRSNVGTCSADSLELDEPLAGTANFASAVVVIEQSGPWGREALTESHLDEGVSAELARRVDGLPVKMYLARASGRHADLHVLPPTQRVWAAVVHPARPRWTSWTITDPAALLDLDLTALAGGVLPTGEGHQSPPATIFLCGNAKRDVCCARDGRRLAAELSTDPALNDRVWEISHLGGHRFAPTALVLPLGVVYGRLDVESAYACLAAAESGEVRAEHQRGLMGLDPVAQAADIAVRERSRVRRADGVQVDEVLEGVHGGELDGWLVTATTSDSTRWSIAVTQERGPDRRESCAKLAVPMTYYRAAILDHAAIA
jgi:hypothetical protein